MIETARAQNAIDGGHRLTPDSHPLFLRERQEMNAQPHTQGEYAAPAPVDNADNASTLGLNPYNRMVNMSNAVQMADVEGSADRRSEGLNGDTLDRLLRGRWQEGHRLGHQEGHNLAAGRYSEVFDEGFVAGNERGSAQMAAQLVGLLREPLDLVTQELEAIAKRSGSTEIKNGTARSLATLKLLVDTLRENVPS